MKDIEKNRAYQKEWMQNWRKNNPDKVKQNNEKRKQIRLTQGDEHYLQNKQIYLQKASEYYQKNKEKISIRNRERHLNKTYNLTSEQYYQMVQEQNGCCAICGKPETRLLKTGDVKPLSVDHDHVTGEVRRLLCNDCNALLGFSHEDIDILEKSIQYLKDFGVERRGW